ncbi:hypothetical protein SDC9_202967 [bioreactor metagenome]|uniref:Zinc-ribbon domain-containing protein n=1 Tax=bioreactor metagenome TaxID=1076179 RepID=A0A645IV34_9ZZZZ
MDKTFNLRDCRTTLENIKGKEFINSAAMLTGTGNFFLDYAAKMLPEALDEIERLQAENERLQAKQTPLKPVQKLDRELGYAWFCPKCGCFIDPSMDSFCPDCGQALVLDSIRKGLKPWNMEDE